MMRFPVIPYIYGVSLCDSWISIIRSQDTRRSYIHRSDRSNGMHRMKHAALTVIYEQPVRFCIQLCRAYLIQATISSDFPITPSFWSHSSNYRYLCLNSWIGLTAREPQASISRSYSSIRIPAHTLSLAHHLPRSAETHAGVVAVLAPTSAALTCECTASPVTVTRGSTASSDLLGL